MRTIAIDFETFYDKDYSVRDMPVDAYVRDSRFNPYMTAVSDGEQSWAGATTDFDWSWVDGAMLVAHNAPFDRVVFEEAQRRGLISAGIKPAGWRCTMQGLGYLWRPMASLKDSVKRFYGVEISKESRDAAKGKLTDFSQSMLDYACADAEWCHRLWAKQVAPYWPEHEQRLANLTVESGIRGVRINRELLEQYIELLQRAIHANETVLPWYPDRAPTSPKGIAEECRKVGIACPPTQTEDEEGYIEWEATFGPRFPWIAAVGRHRSLTKMLAKFKSMHEWMRPDGILSAPLRYFKAHTGRWAGEKINLQNMRRAPLLLTDKLMVIDGAPEREALALHDKTGQWPEWVAHAIDERSLYIAREGHKFVIADLAQIEPRVLNWLVGNDALLDLLRKNRDESVYEAYARGVMGWNGGPLKKENKGLYSLYKMQVLQLGYQSGAETFRSAAESMGGLTLTEEEAEEAVQTFREANPLLSNKTYGLWARLDSQLRASMGGSFSIELPNGRSLRYVDVRRSVRPPRVDKKTGEIRSGGWQTTAVVAGKRVPTYGGKLAENLTQAVARDVFADALLRVSDGGVPILWTAHDEMVGEVPEDAADEALEFAINEMRKVPDWAAGLPTNAEGVVSSVYLK